MNKKLRSRNLHAKTLKVASVNEKTKQAMFTLFQDYYKDVTWPQFCQDFQEKTHVLLFTDDLGVVGFSTILRKQLPLVGRGIFLYSGDTVIREDYWGSKILQMRFVRFMIMTKLKALHRPVYWMLISKGLKTYLLLRKNFAHSFPNPKMATPSLTKKVMDRFYNLRFGSCYNPQSGLIRFDFAKGAVKECKNTVPNPKDFDSQYFLQHNPDYLQGVELACIAKIQWTDLLEQFFKYFIKLLPSAARKKAQQSRPELTHGKTVTADHRLGVVNMGK